MNKRPEFQVRQYEFAAHIRDPDNAPRPDGIEDRRMAVYRDLFFNNLKNLLGTFFPVLRKLHDDPHWHRFIRQFMQQHTAKTPYFLELPEEFLAFLQNEYQPQDDDFPFLIELAHYEYVELALSVAPEAALPENLDPDGDLLAGVPVKSPLAWAFAYHFPVHRISPEFIPTEPAAEPVYLAVYRRADEQVGFMELNPVTAALLDAIEENAAGLTGAELLEKLAAVLDHPDVAVFTGHGQSAMAEMRANNILLGARCRQPEG